MEAGLITYDNFVDDPFQTLQPDDETKGALNILKWAYDAYGDSIIYACSFGAEGIVLVDLIAKVKQDADIVFLDTGLHFPETYELINKVKEKYPSLRIRLKEPDLTLDEQREKYGSALWKRQPDQCCYIRKVKPLEETLQGAVAWLSGLRREQSPTRRNTNFINKDERFQSIKICPLIYWTWEDVWNYIRENNLPYNELHDQGYPSIGCFPCTSPVSKDGDSREGRWSGLNKTECGLHTTGK
ncbi:phosphoadenylyl-sulfate reductase [Heyndrickxia ginsengihumi]|uniref:Adenosine 5'-phosphosulfate reductase n=1 Tax=Heyndrickxia ginsengihumi TaxID=363870 RepID=A0A0A6VGP5_9BACI|nr:phosphoadenylyl-sulfate reductase [Heyndrickxia ginsengihumi]KHD86618.1 phosphoadenosine phosphosulfate reductase [Heyndrickxia ginsengihumi]MBE6185270.1 phosphoadenylyl-sulfate reductase [Bacillus sp. (in: firmicutes)]MCM3022654.1 phosphoadenylyl-sulfate reductase [Heyndrickxia ginsengihumi]NEY19007.1 phosphoadenylyl-sulfate reductase [Heyndrickxia ginsengihumi]